MPTRDITHPSDRLIAAMERLFSYKMTTSGGNLSSLDEEGSSWIPPARIDKGGMKREDIAKFALTLR